MMDIVILIEGLDTRHEERLKRIQKATEALRSSILNSQLIVSSTGIDTKSSWNDYINRRNRSVSDSVSEINRYNGEYIDFIDISNALARLGIRLTDREVKKVMLRIDSHDSLKRDDLDYEAKKNGEIISEEAFRQFAHRSPRRLGEILDVFENELLKDILETYRYSGKNKRDSYFLNKTEIKRNLTSSMSPVKNANHIKRQYESSLARYRDYNQDDDFDQNDQYSISLEKTVKALLQPDFSETVPVLEFKNNLLRYNKLSPNTDDEERENDEIIIKEEILALAQDLGCDKYGEIQVKKFVDAVIMKIFSSHHKDEVPHDIRNPYKEVMAAENLREVNNLCIQIQNYLKETAELPNGTLDYGRAFEEFDTSGDQMITLHELKKGMEGKIVPNINDLQLLQVMERFDENGEGLVSPLEFESFCKRDFKHFIPNEVKYQIYMLNHGGETDVKSSKEHTRRRSRLVEYMIEKENFTDPDENKEISERHKKKVALESFHKGFIQLESINFDLFLGKISGDKVTDTLFTHIIHSLLSTYEIPLEKLKLQEIQYAFASYDPDCAGVITKQEFMEALDKKLKIKINMSSTLITTALNFFEEDENLIDYDGIVHGLSRLRHAITHHIKGFDLLKEQRSKIRLENRDDNGYNSYTGRDKLDSKIEGLRWYLQDMASFIRDKQRKGHESSKTLHRQDPYRIFWKLDEDHDGRLTLSEFKKGLFKISDTKDGDCSWSFTDKETRLLFSYLDDGTHHMVYRDFIEFLLDVEAKKLPTTKSHGNKENKDTIANIAEDYYYSSDDDDEEDDVRLPQGQSNKSRSETLYQDIFNCLLLVEPNEKRRKALMNFLRNFDGRHTGFVPERRFRAFIYKCQLDLHLSRSNIRWLLRDLDPDMTGNVEYAIFNEKINRLEIDYAEKLQKEKEEADKKKAAEEDAKKKGKVKERKPATIDSMASILKKLLDAINLSLMKGKSYHGLFALSDEMQTGIVSRTAFEHTLNMLGCNLEVEEMDDLVAVLPQRSDDKIEYDELYHLILRTPGIGNLVSSGAANLGNTGITPFSPSYTQTRMNMASPYPSNDMTTNLSSTLRRTANPSTFSRSGLSGGLNTNNHLLQTGRSFDEAYIQGDRHLGNTLVTSASSDPLLEQIGFRIREGVRQRIGQWGSSFSLHRQFELIDNEKKGFVNKEEFSRVISQLGIGLSPIEISHLIHKFDRYNDGNIDYNEFIRVIMVDVREIEVIVKRVATKLQEIRKKGTVIQHAFECFDDNASGFVNISHFKNACKQLQLPVTEIQLQTLMDQFSSISDPNMICYLDFLNYVLGNASSVINNISTEYDMLGNTLHTTQYENSNLLTSTWGRGQNSLSEARQKNSETRSEAFLCSSFRFE